MRRAYTEAERFQTHSEALPSLVPQPDDLNRVKDVKRASKRGSRSRWIVTPVGDAQADLTLLKEAKVVARPSRGNFQTQLPQVDSMGTVVRPNELERDAAQSQSGDKSKVATQDESITDSEGHVMRLGSSINDVETG